MTAHVRRAPWRAPDRTRRRRRSGPGRPAGPPAQPGEASSSSSRKAIRAPVEAATAAFRAKATPGPRFMHVAHGQEGLRPQVCRPAGAPRGAWSLSTMTSSRALKSTPCPGQIPTAPPRPSPCGRRWVGMMMLTAAALMTSPWMCETGTVRRSDRIRVRGEAIAVPDMRVSAGAAHTAATSLLGAGRRRPLMPEQPMNILLITLDQFRGDAYAAAGHPFVKTPNLDRLAREGVRLSTALQSSGALRAGPRLPLHRPLPDEQPGDRQRHAAGFPGSTTSPWPAAAPATPRPCSATPIRP